MGKRTPSPIRDKIASVVVLVSILPQVGILHALLQPADAMPQVAQNADGAVVFTLRTASETWFMAAVLALIFMNVAVCVCLRLRARVNSDDLEVGMVSPALVIPGVIFACLLLLACLGVGIGMAKPFYQFRAVVVDEDTVELKMLVDGRRLERAGISDVEIRKGVGHSYAGEDFWFLYVEIHANSGKMYRSVNVGDFDGNEPEAGQWRQLLRKLEASIEQ